MKGDLDFIFKCLDFFGLEWGLDVIVIWSSDRDLLLIVMLFKVSLWFDVYCCLFV